MRNKLARYMAEREKNRLKISKLQARNEELDKLILTEENLVIIAKVRSNLEPEQLNELILGTRMNGEVPFFIEKTEADAYEE